MATEKLNLRKSFFLNQLPRIYKWVKAETFQEFFSISLYINTGFIVIAEVTTFKISNELQP